MLGLDAELAKAQSKTGRRSKAVKRKRTKHTVPSILELNKSHRSSSDACDGTAAAPRSKLHQKAELYERLAQQGVAPLDSDDVMVDFLAKQPEVSPSISTEAAVDSFAGNTGGSAGGHVSGAGGVVTITDEFGRKRSVVPGSQEHKKALREAREANALSKRMQQRQARVQEQQASSAGGEGHAQHQDDW